ncbi:hypothetical protein Zmor_003506 [Zophobas morio]|uniref:protein-tyrosine-phosphatase n=2 Tax=Zophobas morio TaxID=2755281 RepID=A0AA38M1N3_9CUCU|nr:hypothetical protein Zmor_003506 [Zophobas morio]
MEDLANILVNAAEFVPGRLYFVTINTYETPESTSCVHYFTMDEEHRYNSFYNDFGPLNLEVLYGYCRKLDESLADAALHSKKIVHYTGTNDQNRVNAAFLIGAYAVINLNFNPEEAYEVLNKGSKKDYIEFRDASIGQPYTLSLLDCLKAVKKALDHGFFDFNNFDSYEYRHYERVENGDSNWIVPEKFIAFCGPQDESAISSLFYPINTPEMYFPYFRYYNVTTIIRLNKKAYDSNRFVQEGFDHKDLFFIDGGIPDDRILNKFISICENASGAIAVHCKAGLGRTGTLIACYIMKHYKFTAQEAIGWIRICRPGSIIAHQQTWLLQKQKQLWAAGEEYRQKHKMSGPIKHKIGIYPNRSSMNNNKTKVNDNVTGIMKKVNSMEINDKDDFETEENEITQGDRLNEIKAQRAKAKQPLETNLTDCKVVRSKVIVNTSTSPVRDGRITTNTTKSTTSTTRVLTKRNELNESQTTRRCSQRKINASLLAIGKNKVPEAKCLPKKKENLSWLLKNGTMTHDTIAKCSSDNKIESTVKRCKRTLALEKDKASPHSVKVLRRSHGQTSKDSNKKNDGKLHLPSVKINKSI